MPGDGEASDTASTVEMDLDICHFVYLESPAGYPESPISWICDTAGVLGTSFQSSGWDGLNTTQPMSQNFLEKMHELSI